MRRGKRGGRPTPIVSPPPQVVFRRGRFERPRRGATRSRRVVLVHFMGKKFRRTGAGGGGPRPVGG